MTGVFSCNVSLVYVLKCVSAQYSWYPAFPVTLPCPTNNTSQLQINDFEHMCKVLLSQMDCFCDKQKGFLDCFYKRDF